MLFAGSIQLRKGPQYLAQAAARIARIDPSVSFVFAGGVTAAAAEQLRAPNIEVLGHISRDRMQAEFLRADILAFPSLAEGSAGVVLEAMSAGLPIVATREAGVDFRDGESGIMVPPTDVDALTDAIVAIISDRPRRDAMARSARGRNSRRMTNRPGATPLSAPCGSSRAMAERPHLPVVPNSKQRRCTKKLSRDRSISS